MQGHQARLYQSWTIYGKFIETGEVKYLVKAAKTIVTEGVKLLTADEGLIKYVKDQFGDIAGVALEKASSIIGIGFDTVLSFIDNYEEFGEFSARMIAESILEVAVDFVKDNVLKIAATGLVILIGLNPVSLAGAVCVFAISTALSVATDYVIKEATGADSFEEYASDLILDVGAAIYTSATNSVAEFAGGVSEAIAEIQNEKNGTDGGVTVVDSALEYVKEKTTEIAEEYGEQAAKGQEFIDANKEENKESTKVTVESIIEELTNNDSSGVTGGGSGGGRRFIMGL